MKSAPSLLALGVPTCRHATAMLATSSCVPVTKVPDASTLIRVVTTSQTPPWVLITAQSSPTYWLEWLWPLQGAGLLAGFFLESGICAVAWSGLPGLRGYLPELLTAESLDHLVGAEIEAPAPELTCLCGRELELLDYFCQDLGTKEIACRLCLSVETVHNHRRNIKRKLGLSGGKRAFLQYIQPRRELFRSLYVAYKDRTTRL
jgi:DNA-binding CsgD family transcriptional regulator